ncbi:MAG: M23 family metallopeptidase [Patescibacteria group bacterium]|nr:M23 family metallopeptidase [Patescibacteria group bacterium]
MYKRFSLFSLASLRKIKTEFFGFNKFFYLYIKEKVIRISVFFETYKNILVRFFMMKRGRYSRPFLHLATMGVLGIGVISAPFLASTYPVFSQSNPLALDSASSQQSINVGDNVFQTDVSQKPRDKVITYTVQKGDTVSTIAQKFGISADTIRWANDLSEDSLNVGDTLKILPVTGISYKVQKGDTVYSIAKKFDTGAQKIVDFPFNDFANPETFSLVEGQMLVVPDGVKPSEQPFIKRQIYIAQGPTSISSAGFAWPVRGGISQFASWYHMALDITDPVGTPVVAAKDGSVVEALGGAWNWGFGNTIVIDNGDGYKTRYSHLSSINVGVGDNVVGGKTVIGLVGSTGRSTGPHLDFRIIKNGVEVNPLPYLQ